MCFLVFGTENYTARVRFETEEELINLGIVKLGEKIEEKYQGDVLSSLRLQEPVEATVKERSAKIKGTIYELKALIEYCFMQAIGGMEAALDLF